MSMEDASRFLSALDRDPDLRTRASTLEATSRERAATALVGLGADAGYRFSAEELMESLSELVGAIEPAADELDSEELERVSGGITRIPAVHRIRSSSARSS